MTQGKREYISTRLDTQARFQYQSGWKCIPATGVQASKVEDGFDVFGELFRF